MTDVFITWREWKTWTDDPTNQIADVEAGLQDLWDHAKVREFIGYLTDYLTWLRIQELTRNMDDPNRKQRSYFDALREITLRLELLKQKENEGNGGGTYSVFGRGG